VSDDFRVDSLKKQLVITREEHCEAMAKSLAVNRVKDLQERTGG
jgi:hypothetical protein